MDSYWEPFEWGFEGPLVEATGLPTAILYNVVLLIRHAASNQIAEQLWALAPVLGAPELRRGLFRKWLEFPGPPTARATWTSEQVELRFRQRLKPNRLQRVIRALAAIPGAKDARLRGERQRFAEAGSRGGAPMDG